MCRLLSVGWRVNELCRFLLGLLIDPLGAGGNGRGGPDPSRITDRQVGVASAFSLVASFFSLMELFPARTGGGWNKQTMQPPTTHPPTSPPPPTPEIKKNVVV